MLYRDIYQSYRHTPPGVSERVNDFKPTFALKAQQDGFDLYIYDVIGCDCCEPADIVSALATAGGAPIRVRMNSPGGDAFAGFAIFNLLANYEGEVSVLIDGVCASAAAYIAMSGATIEMQPASFLMIHNSWTISVGDRNRLATQISALERIDAAQTAIFSERTGIPQNEIVAMLAAETWLSADEAVAQGFADSIVGDSSSETVDAVLANALEDIFAFDKRKRMLSARLLTRHLSD